MKRLNVCFLALWTLGGCARESRKVEVLPQPKTNSGNTPTPPDIKNPEGGTAAAPSSQSSQNSKSGGAGTSSSGDPKEPTQSQGGTNLGTTPSSTNSEGKTNVSFSGKYQIFYSFPSQNRKDCLANRGGNQIGIVSCTNNNPDLGFEIKSVGTQGYHIKALATEKCMVLNLKSNFQDPAADALMQGPCEQTEDQNPFFSLEPSKDLTKLTIEGLCVKIGVKGNLYLADCNTSWTWFSKSTL